MDLTQLNQRIAVANAESQRINNERAVNIGKKETLEKQLQDAITRYNTTYNTSIDVSSLTSEIERVAKEKEEEVSNIESILSLIKEGRFEEAQSKVSGVATNQVTPVVTESSPVVVQSKEQSTTPHTHIIEDELKNSEMITSSANITTESKPVISTVDSEVVKPVAQTVNSEVVKPVAPRLDDVVAPSVPVPPVVNNSDEDTIPIGIPPVIGKPPVVSSVPTPLNLGGANQQSAPVTSFNAILNGSQFKPQGV